MSARLHDVIGWRYDQGYRKGEKSSCEGVLELDEAVGPIFEALVTVA